MTAILSKLGIPLMFLTIGFSAGYIFKDKTTKPIQFDYDRIRKSVSEEVGKIPQPKPQGSSIDIEKLKGFKGTFAVHQHTHIEANGDSLIFENFKKELERLRLARCK